LRQIHWHAQNEIAYVISGSARVGVVGSSGEQSFFNVSAGDVWYFPAGFAQYFQAGPDGVEIVLWFNKDSISTITVPQLFEAVPKKQFQDSFFVNDTSFFPEWDLSVSGTACPKVKPTWTIAPSTCESTSEFKLTIPCSSATKIDSAGNELGEAIASAFPILEGNGLAISYAVIKVGCQRVLHWHAVPGELALVLQGSAEIGLFSFANSSEETTFYKFEGGAGDIWFFPPGNLQYITNTGDVDVIAVLGFSYDSLETLLQSGSLKPIPEDIVGLSLGVNDDAFFSKWQLSDTDFTCINKP